MYACAHCDENVNEHVVKWNFLNMNEYGWMKMVQFGHVWMWMNMLSIQRKEWTMTMKVSCPYFLYYVPFYRDEWMKSTCPRP